MASKARKGPIRELGGLPTELGESLKELGGSIRELGGPKRELGWPQRELRGPREREGDRERKQSIFSRYYGPFVGSAAQKRVTDRLTVESTATSHVASYRLEISRRRVRLLEGKQQNKFKGE